MPSDVDGDGAFAVGFLSREIEASCIEYKDGWVRVRIEDCAMADLDPYQQAKLKRFMENPLAFVPKADKFQTWREDWGKQTVFAFRLSRGQLREPELLPAPDPHSSEEETPLRETPLVLLAPR